MNDSNEINPDTQLAPQLTAIELRVLGALMEKQLTTPEQYPLTVNSLVSACNQKSSRDPVTNYQQGEIVRTLHMLENRMLIRREPGSRAEKYSQQFMSYIELGKKPQSVLCVLMLRGPQTESELYTRTQRMECFSDRDELIHCIQRLCDRQIPYVVRLGHLPGQREERLGHLFSGMPELTKEPGRGASTSQVSAAQQKEEALALMELDIAELNDEVKNMKLVNEKLSAQLEKLYELTGNSDKLT